MKVDYDERPKRATTRRHITRGEWDRITEDSADPWILLANAIIMQAVQDYRRALNGNAPCRGFTIPSRGRSGNIRFIKATRSMAIKECEDFFKSGWCYDLCEIEPERLLQIAQAGKGRAHKEHHHGI